MALLAGAAALAAAAVWNNARARRAERGHPPRGRFLKVGGVRLHDLERGAGPPVVLLHGNVVTAEDYLWSGVLEAAFHDQLKTSWWVGAAQRLPVASCFPSDRELRA